ncbi:hypothetical protein [Otariodibacter oris]|nr:hypothetical protein [Otariodibacter oris]
MRNQLNFSLFGVGLLIILQIIALYFLPDSNVSPESMHSVSSMEDIDMLAFSSAIIWALLSIWVNILLILNIKSINAGRYHSFLNNGNEALKRLIPVTILNLVTVVPALIFSLPGMSIITGGVLFSSMGVAVMMFFIMVGVVVMLPGILVFVKYSLVTYVHLVEEPKKSIGETLKFTWAMSREKMKLLFIFCGITSLFPLLVNAWLSQLDRDMGILIAIISAFINVFMVIFSFRFYQVYRELPIAQRKGEKI